MNSTLTSARMERPSAEPPARRRADRVRDAHAHGRRGRLRHARARGDAPRVPDRRHASTRTPRAAAADAAVQSPRLRGRPARPPRRDPGGIPERAAVRIRRERGDRARGAIQRREREEESLRRGGVRVPGVRHDRGRRVFAVRAAPG
eukprot:30906-Pelagococcus_subviridis.AAC.10